MKSQLLIVLLAVASTSAAASKPIEVSIGEVVRHPQRFNGKQVSFRAYFGFGGHSCYFSETREAQEKTVFADLDHTSLSRRSIESVPHGCFIHVAGTFQYRPITRRVIPRPETKATPYPGNVERDLVEVTIGFGWMGIYDMQLTRLTEFKRT